VHTHVVGSCDAGQTVGRALVRRGRVCLTASITEDEALSPCVCVQSTGHFGVRGGGGLCVTCDL
jgi:hypothetical protein